MLRSQMVKEMSDGIKKIKKWLFTAQSRQKSYVDERRRPLGCAIRDKVFLKVSPRCCIQKYNKHRKFAPWFAGSFEILEIVGSVVYQLAPKLAKVHDVFHVSML